MRFKDNREHFLPKGCRKDGKLDMRLKINRKKLLNPPSSESDSD